MQPVISKSHTALVAEIETALENRYGSLRHPNFAFAQQAVAEGLYRQEREIILAQFGALDDTDLNNDVGHFFIFEANGNGYALLLSFVGPYATLLKGEGEECQTLPQPRFQPTPTEQKILDFLTARGFVMLDKEILSQPIRMKLDIEKPTLYNALFTCTPPAWLKKTNCGSV